MKRYIPNKSRTKHRGFALIATISIASLLMLIALAMLSLSSVEVRQQGTMAHQERARANARMAAMLALGELQLKLGADQRVTATAAIVDDSVDAQKRNWTTVWDTSTWDPEDPEGTRDDAYMGALVSGNEYTEASSRSAAVSPLSSAIDPSDENWIEMVGEESVELDDDYVYAPRVDVLDDSGDTSGGYAYWVSDEGVKARIDIGTSPDAPSNTWATTGTLASAPGTGIHKVSGLENYTTYLPDGAEADNLTNFMSLGSFDLSSLDSVSIKDNFHHLTATHTGLLVDNYLGGIRRDLSTAFEIDAEDFSEITEFNNSGETNETEEYSTFSPSSVKTNPLYYHNGTDPELGYLYEVPVDSTNRYRGPTWDLLRNHYRLYKKERNALNFRGLPTPSSDALIAHGVVPMSYTGEVGSGTVGSSIGSVIEAPNYSGVNGSAQYPMVSAHGQSGGHVARDGNRMQPTVQKISPELIRSVIVFGIAKDQDEFHMTATPYFTFHNPYNHPLEFYSLSVDMRGIGAYTYFNVDYVNEADQNKSTTMRFQGIGGQNLKFMTSYRLAPPTSGLYRLEPGEIRMMSMLPNTDKADEGQNNIRLTEFKYNQENGLVSELDDANTSNQIEVKEDSMMTMTIGTKENVSTLGSIFSRLYHPESATGGAYALDDIGTFSNNNNANTNRYNDTEPLSLIKQMKMLPYNKVYNGVDKEGNPEQRVFNENQVTTPDNGYLALFVMDMRMKTFESDVAVAVMNDFNYRSLGMGPREYDSGDVLGPNWDFEIRPIGDYSELQLTDDVNGSAYWGASTEAGSGSSRIVLFDLPRTPSVSLATLQHADTSKLHFHPMRSIAHSRAQVGQSDLTKIYAKLSRQRANTDPKDQIDTSWASNEALWNRYYYSGINWGDESGQPYSTQEEAIQAIIDGDADKVFANTRIELMQQVNDSDLAELTGEDAYAKLGNYLGIKGAFNVNSTSVEAWKAVLASLSGHEISYLTGSTITQEKLDNDLSPISRFSTPAGDENDDLTGFRALSDTELDELAVAMVEQVKLRGPFMGLADFVNRRLVDDETGESGAIQAAIDSTSINSSVANGTVNDPGLKQSSVDANTGIARYFDQGDVLTSLAPIMATRSDTFVIRAYGDSKDNNGNIKAKAWCEVIVQRTPEWLVHTDEEATVQHSDYPASNPTNYPILKHWDENPSLPDTCKKFGRKFAVKSFRWLSNNEI
ncbi:MAG: hypothetical protein ACSHX6_03160 [Akkermansiaceae bacterium]